MVDVPGHKTHDVCAEPVGQVQEAPGRVAFRYACSRCGRAKPWPASKCVDCPKKPSADGPSAADGFATTATLPEPPLKELAATARLVKRLGGAYVLRTIADPSGGPAKEAAERPTEAAAAPEKAAVAGKERPSGCEVSGWRADEQEAAEEAEAEALAGPHAKASDKTATWFEEEEDDDGDEDDDDGGGGGGGGDGDSAADKAHCEKVLTGTGANRSRSSSRRLPKQLYPVEKALQCVNVEGAGRAYLVKWEGYPASASEWVLEEHVTQQVIDDFHKDGYAIPAARARPDATASHRDRATVGRGAGDSAYSLAGGAAWCSA